MRNEDGICLVEFRQHGEFAGLENFLFYRFTYEKAPSHILIKVRPGTPAAFEERLSKKLRGDPRIAKHSITAVLDLIKRGGRVVAGVVKDTKRRTIQPHVRGMVEPGATIYTDALPSYEGLEDDRFVLRSMTDEIMYELMMLSGQEYVDTYAAKAKAEQTAARKGESGERDNERPAA